MPATPSLNPLLAALGAIGLAAIGIASIVTLPLNYYSDPNDKVGLITRVIVIGFTIGACYHLCRVTRGLGKAIPLVALAIILGLLVYVVVWALV